MGLGGWLVATFSLCLYSFQESGFAVAIDSGDEWIWGRSWCLYMGFEGVVLCI